MSDTDRPATDLPDDVEGHGIRRAFAEQLDETEGAEGHAFRRSLTDRPDEDDDVSGHITGALGSQQRDEL